MDLFLLLTNWCKYFIFIIFMWQPNSQNAFFKSMFRFFLSKWSVLLHLLRRAIWFMYFRNLTYKCELAGNLFAFDKQYTFMHAVLVVGNPHLKPQQMRFCSVPPPSKRSPQINNSDRTHPSFDSKTISGTVLLAHHGLRYLIGVILLSNSRQIHDLLFGSLMDAIL